MNEASAVGAPLVSFWLKLSKLQENVLLTVERVPDDLVLCLLSSQYVSENGMDSNQLGSLSFINSLWLTSWFDFHMSLRKSYWFKIHHEPDLPFCLISEFSETFDELVAHESPVPHCYFSSMKFIKINEWLAP